MSIKDDLLMLQLNPTYYKISEVIIACSNLASNKYLFKNIDCTNVEEIIELANKVIENPDLYKRNPSIIDNKEKKDFKLRIKELVSNKIFEKINFNESRPLANIKEETIFNYQEALSEDEEILDTDSEYEEENDDDLYSELNSDQYPSDLEDIKSIASIASIGSNIQEEEDYSDSEFSD